MKHIIIIGGGITGLAAAYFLKKQNFKVTLLEKEKRVGGWISSYRKDHFLIEEGPRAFRNVGHGKLTYELIQQLQLPFFEVEATKRYLYLNQKLQPLSFPFFLKEKGFQTLLKAFTTSVQTFDDESIATFFTRQFNHHFTETFIDPLVKGIFGGDPKQLSLRSCFPRIWELAKQQGSLGYRLLRQRQEKSSLISLKGGMERLTSTLSDRLEKEIQLSQEVKQITFYNDKVVVNGAIEGDHVIAALPSFQLSSLLPQADFLNEIPFLSMTTVHIGFQKELLPHHGFGYLVPSKEGEKILGMIWDSHIRSEGQSQLSVMIQGAVNENDAIEIALLALGKHLNIHDSPDFIHVTTAMRAIPQYPVGHCQLVQRFDSPHITLAGNSYHGVGINDCIASARLSVATIIQKFQK